MKRKQTRPVPPSKRLASFRPRLEALEDRLAPATHTQPLIPGLDEFGNQFPVVQIYRGFDALGNPIDATTFGIYDTGASPVTFSYLDQLFFGDFLNPDDPAGRIPVIPGAEVVAEGIGGSLTGLVSQPGTLIADGMHAVDLEAFLSGPDYLDLSGAPSVDNVQAMIGTELGSPHLPAIVGTPIHNARLPGAATDGVAALIDQQGFLLDLNELFPGMGFEGLILPLPDVFFVAPGTQLTQGPETTAPMIIPIDFLGIDNHEDPGETITESFNPVVNDVQLTNTPAGTPLQVGGQMFLYDTGAQLSIISTAIALQLGLDLNAPEMTIAIGGAGGELSVPGYTIDELIVPRDDDNDGVNDGSLIFTDVPIFVLDVGAGLDGILGMNLFNPAAKMLYDPHDPDGAGPAGPSLQIIFSTAPRDVVDPEAAAAANLLFPSFAGSLGGQLAPHFEITETSSPGPPTLAADAPAVSVSEGNLATNTGTFSDPDGDSVVISADIGTVVQNGSTGGTWSWSLFTGDGPEGPVTVTITADDGDDGFSTTTFTYQVLNAAPSIALDGETTVTVGEGSQASKTGTFADFVDDDVTITASAGVIEQFGTQSGSWSWSLNTTDGPDQSQTVTITATDSDGAQSTVSFGLVVSNFAPAVAVTGSFMVIVNETQQAVNAGTFADLGADIVTITASVGAITQVGAQSGSWSWSLTPADGPDQSQTVTITATDSDGAQSTATFSLVVNNLAPSVAVTGAPTVTVSEGALATKSGTFADLGADVVTITVSAGTINQVGTQTGTWSWALLAADGPDQSQTVTITATDSDGAQSSVSFDLVVNNLAPAINLTGNSIVAVGEGAQATNAGTFADLGADIVTITASVGAINQVGSQAGTWAWSLNTVDGPDQGQTVTITATDSDGAQATVSFTLAVNNLAPTLTLTGGSTVTVTETALASKSGTFLDPGFDFVTITASAGTINQVGSQAGSWSWSLGTSDGPDQSQTVTITATDSDGGQSSVTFNLVVTNLGPTLALDGGTTVTVNEAAQATTTGSFADGGADSVTITASVGTISQVGSQAGTWSWSLGTGDGPNQSQTVTITATDSDGAQATVTFNLVVNNLPPALAIVGSPTQSVNEGSQATAAGTFSDLGADVVTITASVGTISQVGTQAGTWSWSFNTTDGPDQTQTVTITATDSDGAQSTATFSLAVNNVSPTLTITGAGTVTVNEGTQATKTGTFADLGADIVTISASVGTITKVGTQQGNWTWSFNTTDGPEQSQTVTIVAADGEGAQAFLTFELVVQNVAPTITLFGNPQASPGVPYQLQFGPVVDGGQDTITGYQINWGDGETTFHTGSPSGQTVPHTYDNGGINPVITVTLTDEDGAPHALPAGSTTIAVQSPPDLKLTQKIKPTLVARGGMVTFTITVANAGQGQATGAVALLKLPANMSFLKTGSSAGWRNAGRGKFRFNVGTLAPGQTVKLTFKARVHILSARGSVLKSKLTVSDDGANGPDANPADNAAKAQVRVA